MPTPRALALLPVALALLATGAWGAWTAGETPAPGAGEVKRFLLEAVAVPCAAWPDGVCLAYNGTIPGPTITLDLGDVAEVTLVNRVAATIDGVGTIDAANRSRFARAPVSLHSHGVAKAAAEDGVLDHPGTRLVRSAAEPGGSFTYRWHATRPGPWHYHDHVVDGHEGIEGLERGLFAMLVVRDATPAPEPDVVVPVVLTDKGMNLRRQPDVPDVHARAGDTLRFDLIAHGTFLHTFEVEDPAGAVVYARQYGPGESDFVVLPDLAPGTYVYRSIGFPIPDAADWGRVVVA